MRRFVVTVLLAMSSGTLLSAQTRTERGGLAIIRGADTLVIDRFVRGGDSLTGRVEVKAQPPIEYLVRLGPNDAVQSLTISVAAPGAAANAPSHRVRILMRGDSVTAETPSGAQHIATKSGAIPMFNNALAMTELFTRRARASGGVADIPWFAITGGQTIDVAVRPVGTDSLTVAIAQQVQRFRVDPEGRILGGTINGLPLRFVRLGPEAAAGLKVELRDSSASPKPDYSAPPGAPYTAEDVRLNGPDGVLGGTLTKPIGLRGRLPAIVTITGSGQQDRDEYIPFSGGIRLFRQVADTLSRRGIAVLRLDDRGLGESGGSPANATTADFANDIRAGIAYLRSRPDIDANRIGLVGHSEGGVIAPMIAATDPRIKAIVIMAGPADPGIEISMAQNKYVVDHDAALTPAQRDSILRAARASLDPARQKNPWIKYWMGYDPAAAARRDKAPTLILQGATDRQVPAEQAEKLAALIRSGGNHDVTVHVFPATNHLFISDSTGDFNNYDKLRTNLVAPDILGTLADWLVVRLGAHEGA